MRVGIVLGRADPTAGGGHTFQTEILDALLSQGFRSSHSFVLFCHSDTAAKLANRHFANIEIVILDKEGGKARSLDAQVNAVGVDFVWQLGAPGLVLETPYMVVVWDLQHRLQPWFPEVSANGTWQHRETHHREVLGRAAKIIVGTQTGKAEVERFFGVDSSRIIILPHPTPQFALHAKQTATSVAARIGVTGDYLFYPAQFWAHKNHVNLLHALDRLKNAYNRRFDMVFVGADHGNLEHVRHVSEDLGLVDKTHFLGFIPRDDLIGLYREAFALAYVTFFGPENLPPLEAFALGCPVIASKVPGAEEQLQDAAIFVDPKSPDDIAKAVMRLQEDAGLRENLMVKGRDIAAQRSSETFVAAALAVLDDFEAIRRCWP